MVKSDSPLVSVAIVSCNHRDYLIECIESVRAQNYENVELVIGDDASEDGSQSYLETLSGDRRFVRVATILHGARVGITRNTNAVLSCCSGKYIAWMGGDDVMLPGKIRKQVEVLEAEPEIELCFHDLILFESCSGKYLGNMNGPDTPRRGTWVQLVQLGTINGACSTMTRNPGGRVKFNERYPVASDWRFWIDLLRSSGGQFVYLDEVLGKYRRHGGNVSSAGGPHYRQAMLDHFLTIGDLWVDGGAPSHALTSRLGNLAFSLRKVSGHKLQYAQCLGIALALGPRWKAAIGLFAFLASGCQIRL